MSTASRPWLRARILATFAAGRGLLLGRASAGPDHRAFEGAGWAHVDERGRVDRCDSAHDLAAVVLARHTTAEIRRAVAWAWRHEIEAAAHDQAEAAQRSALDRYRERPSLYRGQP